MTPTKEKTTSNKQLLVKVYRIANHYVIIIIKWYHILINSNFGLHYQFFCEIIIALIIFILYTVGFKIECNFRKWGFY